MIAPPGGSSADTVVQSPFNPQTLNRYSYCLNNPMKYIDPSGNIVEFENEELMLWYINNGYLDISSDTEIGRMLDEWAELRCAWDELSEAAPEVAFVMENTDKVINIGFGNAGDHGAITIPDYPAWNDSPDENGNYIPNSFKIEINGNKIDNVTTLTGVLVHESFHILADLMGTTYKTMSVNGNRMWASNWRLEEAYAYSYQAQVLMKLGVGGGGNDYNSMIVNYFGGMSPGATYANLNASGSGFLQKYYYGYNIYPSEKSQKLGVLILSYYLLFPGQ